MIKKVLILITFKILILNTSLSSSNAQVCTDIFIKNLSQYRISLIRLDNEFQAMINHWENDQQINSELLESVQDIRINNRLDIISLMEHLLQISLSFKSYADQRHQHIKTTLTSTDGYGRVKLTNSVRTTLSQAERLLEWGTRLYRLQNNVVDQVSKRGQEMTSEEKNIFHENWLRPAQVLQKKTAEQLTTLNETLMSYDGMEKTIETQIGGPSLPLFKETPWSRLTESFQYRPLSGTKATRKNQFEIAR